MVQPKIVIRNAHFMKGDLFCIFEEAIWSPNAVQPFNIEYSVFFVHILRKT